MMLEADGEMLCLVYCSEIVRITADDETDPATEGLASAEQGSSWTCCSCASLRSPSEDSGYCSSSQFGNWRLWQKDVVESHYWWKSQAIAPDFERGNHYFVSSSANFDVVDADSSSEMIEVSCCFGENPGTLGSFCDHCLLLVLKSVLLIIWYKLTILTIELIS